MTNLLLGGVVLAVLVFAYGMLVAARPFVGLVLAAGILLATWELANKSGDLNRREAAAWALAGLVGDARRPGAVGFAV